MSVWTSCWLEILASIRKRKRISPMWCDELAPWMIDDMEDMLDVGRVVEGGEVEVDDGGDLRR